MAIEINGLEMAINELEGLSDINALEAAITRGVLILERAARQKAPKGELQRSITSKVDGLTGTVYTPLEYAPYVEFGTGLFSIHPMGGRKEVPWVYVEGSSHKPSKKTVHTEESALKAKHYLESLGLEAHITSGQEPQPFMRPALDENREEIKRAIGEAIVKHD